MCCVFETGLALRVADAGLAERTAGLEPGRELLEDAGRELPEVAGRALPEAAGREDEGLPFPLLAALAGQRLAEAPRECPDEGREEAGRDEEGLDSEPER